MFYLTFNICNHWKQKPSITDLLHEFLTARWLVKNCLWDSTNNMGKDINEENKSSIDRDVFYPEFLLTSKCCFLFTRDVKLNKL